MAHRIYRHFRVVDCSRHLGLPVSLACFALAILSGAANAYALYFLPDTWNYILMGYAGATAGVGLLAVLTGFRLFTVLYLLAESLSRIPVGVVIGYTSWALSWYKDHCDPYNYRGSWNNWNDCVSSYTNYEWKLFNTDNGMLWSGDIVACVSFIISFTTLAGFRKLRLHQAGVTASVETHRNHRVEEVVVEDCHHHHHQPAVVTIPQPTVVTVPQPTVVTLQQPTVVTVQQPPPLYPQLPTYGAQPAVYQMNPQVQPVAYMPYDKQ